MKVAQLSVLAIAPANGLAHAQMSGMSMPATPTASAATLQSAPRCHDMRQTCVARGRTTISFTSTSSGCSIANWMARPIAAGSMATLR